METPRQPDSSKVNISVDPISVRVVIQPSPVRFFPLLVILYFFGQFAYVLRTQGVRGLNVSEWGGWLFAAVFIVWIGLYQLPAKEITLFQDGFLHMQRRFFGFTYRIQKYDLKRVQNLKSHPLTHCVSFDYGEMTVSLTHEMGEPAAERMIDLVRQRYGLR